MAIKDQLIKIKENWLLLAAVLVLFIFLNFGNLGAFSIGAFSRQVSFGNDAMESAKMPASGAMYQSSRYGITLPVPNYGDFAPEIQDRKITKSSSLNAEVEAGTFKDAESRLKSIIKLSSSYLLNENVNKYDSGWKSYYTGTYQIKVDSRKYSDVVSQLKGIGEVKSFNENAEDITASHKNLEIEINVEKQRLERYSKMYAEAALMADKIQLSDKILEEERTIKYMEDSLKNVNQRVDYSTIYVTLNEKQPKYSGIQLVKLQELVRKLVGSINSLLSLIFAAAPYAIATLVIWFAVRLFRRGKNKK